MSDNQKYRVLFVCLGNICRSPTAEGVFTKMVEQKGLADRFTIDSAGTANYHVGDPPDPRSQKHALKRGYDLSQLRGRQFKVSDFENFDQIIVMDDSNYKNVNKLAKSDVDTQKVSKLTDYLIPSSRFKNNIGQVPDPYLEGPEGFETVLDLVENCCENLLQKIVEMKSL